MRALIDFTAIQAPPPADGHTPQQSALAAGSEALRVAFGAPREVLVAHELGQVKAVLQAVQQRSMQGQWCVGYVRYEAAPAFDAALAVRPASGPLVWFGVHDAPLLPADAHDPMAFDPPAASSSSSQESENRNASFTTGSHFSSRPPAPRPGSESTEAALGSGIGIGIGIGSDAAADGAVAQPPADNCRVTWQPGIARATFDSALEHLHQAIAAGEIYQANFTARSVGQLHVPALDLFAALRQAQPGGFCAYLDTGDEQILSVSPELFFDWHQGHIVTRPMKGTAPRGRNPEEDAALAQALQASPKERAENVMIVDLIRNDLSRLAQPFSVLVDGLCRVQALPTVWQMVTDVHADARPGTTLVDVFAALFPCGSVTGAPKVQAMRLIRELEDTERGVYCGALGVVRPGGSATFNVPIRTVVARGTTVRAGTGSAITSDARAPAEWQEWQHKQAFLHRASQSFEILETLAMREGVLPQAAAHLARMAASAAHFGFVWRPHAAQQALADLALQHPTGAWRVRLLLDGFGHLRAEAFTLAPTPETVRLQLANAPLGEADSEFVRHKTTRRAHYERFAPVDPDVFDTVLWNAAGEVTECTRGNLAFLLDGRWLTPAAGCGLLPGVGRAYWLAQGRMVEGVIRVSDLPRVQALAFVNSLRGWVDAAWAKPPSACLPDI